MGYTAQTGSTPPLGALGCSHQLGTERWGQNDAASVCAAMLLLQLLLKTQDFTAYNM